MHRLIKRDGLVASVGFNQYSNQSVQISGEVYPFAQRFHSVRFKAQRGGDFIEDPQAVSFECGFGGNTFKGEQFDLLLKAGQLASDLAKYYASRLEEFCDPATAFSALNAAFKEGDFAAALEVLVMVPKTKNKANLVDSPESRKFAQKKMCVMDLAYQLPKFLCILEKLDEAADGSEEAWDSVEVDILRVFFNASDSWRTLNDRIPEEADFTYRAKVMRQVMSEGVSDFRNKGLFTALQESYGDNKA